MYTSISANSKNQKIFSRPETVSKLSIFAISILIVMKIAASISTGSIGLRADAIHSSIDLLGAIIGFIAIIISGRPADDRHNFGHGKAEDIAGTLVGGLIFLAAGTILYESVSRLISGGDVELVSLGIYITVAAIAVNACISWWALRIARASESMALEATGRDLLADMFSSVAVLVGLVLVKFTGNSIADPIVSILVALLIIRTAYHTVKKSVGGLMDTRLPDDEQETIKSIITQHGKPVVGFHELRTRKVGKERYINMHLVTPNSASLDEVHTLCDQLEYKIKVKLQYAYIAIHVEPCNFECIQCTVSCNYQENV